MHDHRPDDAMTPPPEVETLVGRLLDREADMQERTRFEGLAAAEPDLWRTLAVRMLDMDLLADGVEERVAAADRIEIGAVPVRHRLAGLAVTLSGWAAVLLMGIVWVAASARLPESVPPGTLPSEGPPIGQQLTPQERLRDYLQSEHVIGELEPTFLGVEQLPDGRERHRIIRRIEEYEYPPAPR